MKFYFLYLIIVVSVSLFFLGLHNIDLAYNFANSPGQDCNGFICQSNHDMYVTGTISIFISYFLGVFSIFIFEVKNDTRNR